MFFMLKKRKGINMCRKLAEIHDNQPKDFLKETNSLPINIEEILKQWEIDFFPVSFEELQKNIPLKNGKITGMAYAQNDDLAILYSKESSVVHSRFTLAHELAHCCLHMNVDSSCHIEFQTINDVLTVSQDKMKRFNEKKEEEADRFARDLLMPTRAMLLLLEKRTNLTLEKLAEIFLVPIEQVQKKLEDIHSNACC